MTFWLGQLFHRQDFLATVEDYNILSGEAMQSFLYIEYIQYSFLLEHSVWLVFSTFYSPTGIKIIDLLFVFIFLCKFYQWLIYFSSLAMSSVSVTLCWYCLHCTSFVIYRTSSSYSFLRGKCVLHYNKGVFRTRLIVITEINRASNQVTLTSYNCKSATILLKCYFSNLQLCSVYLQKWVDWLLKSNHVCMCVYLHFHMWLYVYIYICVCICLYICTYIYVYKCKHTHTWACIICSFRSQFFLISLYMYTHIYMYTYV